MNNIILNNETYPLHPIYSNGKFKNHDFFSVCVKAPELTINRNYLKRNYTPNYIDETIFNEIRQLSPFEKINPNFRHLLEPIPKFKGPIQEFVSLLKAALKNYLIKIWDNKKPVLVRKEVPGFIVNRITGAIEREIDYLLDNGIVTPEDLDIAIKGSIGFRFACLGPMEVEDMIGLDTAKIVSGRVFKMLSNATEPSIELIKKVEKGELGIKSGKGWYDYSGKTITEVNDANNKKLLRQLALFNSENK